MKFYHIKIFLDSRSLFIVILRFVIRNISINYRINMTSKITEILNLDYNNINLVITDKYMEVFNANQTPYPIFDQYITDIFWPQTKTYGDSIVCQTTGPIAINTNIIWNLNESSLSLEIVPFANCQGIPIKVTSIQSSDLSNSSFTINRNKITIDSGYGNLNRFRTLGTSNLPLPGNY